MSQINVKIDENLLAEFRDIIYRTKGLRKGSFKSSLEEAMTDYTKKHSN